MSYEEDMRKLYADAKGPHIVERIRLTRQEFEAMRTAESPTNLFGGPYTMHKVLIEGKWHACDRQYSCGVPMHFARPIVVVLGRE